MHGSKTLILVLMGVIIDVLWRRFVSSFPSQLMENVRCWQAPYGTRVGRMTTFVSHVCLRQLISPTRMYVKLDYISSLLPQTACLGKICGPRYLGPKLAKSAIFSVFFSFSNITFEILILEEKIWLFQAPFSWQLGWKLSQRHSATWKRRGLMSSTFM